MNVADLPTFPDDDPDPDPRAWQPVPLDPTLSDATVTCEVFEERGRARTAESARVHGHPGPFQARGAGARGSWGASAAAGSWRDGLF